MSEDFQDPDGLFADAKLDDAPGPAVPLEAFAEERMVQQVMDVWQATERPRRRPGLPWLAAAAVLVFAGAPAAWAMRGVVGEVVARLTASAPRTQDASTASPSSSGEAGVEASEPGGPAEPGGPVDPFSGGPAGPPGPADPLSGGPASGGAEAVSGPVLASDDPAAPASRRPVEPSGRPITSPSSGRSGSGADASGASASTPSSSPGWGGAAGRSFPQPSRSAAEALLVQASRLRAERRWTEAVRIYARVRREGPAPSAHVAAVAEGDIRLQQLGDAAGARRAYRAARRRLPTGPLIPEAWLGEGNAALADGDPAAARAAWKQVVRGHPESTAAERASRRLRSAR